METRSSVHTSVLLQEVIDHLHLTVGDNVFDGTYGGGGYSRSIAEHIGPTGHIYATDQDNDVVATLQKTLPAHITLHHANFSDVVDIVPVKLQGAVLDLGISSDQLDSQVRGISFRHDDAPLDMRMDASPDNHLTAWGILHTWEEKEIADMIFLYGGDRSSRKIARAIVGRRGTNSLETVKDLVETIESVCPRRGRIHPATQTFQALRIVVNNELGHLEKFLETIPSVMAEGGRLVIVSFHSLEDKIVKQAMRDWKHKKMGTSITPKPVLPSREEVRRNPRSRSARLRSFIFL